MWKSLARGLMSLPRHRELQDDDRPVLLHALDPRLDRLAQEPGWIGLTRRRLRGGRLGLLLAEVLRADPAVRVDLLHRCRLAVLADIEGLPARRPRQHREALQHRLAANVQRNAHLVGQVLAVGAAGLAHRAQPVEQRAERLVLRGEAIHRRGERISGATSPKLCFYF